MISTDIHDGCVKSKGEEKIGQILTQYDISFGREFQVTIKNSIHKFDFVIFNNESIQYFIEYDGIQHRKSIDFFGGENQFNNQLERDAIKNQWCKENNIPLIRIPYTHLKDLCIEDLKLETTKFLVI